MKQRFNPDCNTFEEIVEYFIKRSIQLLFHGYYVHRITEYSFGAKALILQIGGSQEPYYSIYIAKDKRGKGLYMSHYNSCFPEHKKILTTDDCALRPFLLKNNIEFKEISLNNIYTYGFPYKIIANHYGADKTKRSNVDYMNHIDEGLFIAKEIMNGGISKDSILYPSDFNKAIEAYSYHPIFQSDDALKSIMSNTYVTIGMLRGMSPESIVLAMEYRKTANAYLLGGHVNSANSIELSPLTNVNFMLAIDKIQNKKDFELYHNGKHEKSNELEEYFNNWLERLGISETNYNEIVDELKRYTTPQIERL